MKRFAYVISTVIMICLVVIAADWWVDRSRTELVLRQLQEVADQYSILIVTKDEPFPISTTGGPISGKDATRWRLASFAPLLASELCVYPRDFLRGTQLRRIVLCGDLTRLGNRRGAVLDYQGNALYLDVHRATHNREYIRRGFHHELFHIVDYHDDGFVYRDKVWSDLNASDFTYGRGGAEFKKQHRVTRRYDQIPGFLNEYSTSGVEEDKAEVFTSMICDYSYVSRRAENDPVIRAKVERMKQLLLWFSDDMGAEFWETVSQRN